MIAIANHVTITSVVRFSLISGNGETGLSSQSLNTLFTNTDPDVRLLPLTVVIVRPILIFFSGRH